MQKKYEILLADPPWGYRVWSKKGLGRSAENHYPTMKLEDICALPVADIAEADSALFLWATYPNLPEAFEVIKAWGYSYKTVAFTWVKRNKKSPGYFVGCGYWTRANAELCLLATKGHPKRLSKSVRQIIDTPIGRHSEKPAETRTRIVELMGDLTRIELFARERTEGWDCWGNEVDSELVSIQGSIGVLSREIALHHHEWVSGAGYWGIPADTLPPYVAMVSISDVLVALLSERPYKRRWPPNEAIDYIISQAGTQFNPSLVKRFVSLVRNDNRVSAIFTEV